MKKIMFNDKYGLTKAVLEGKKTQTRRFTQMQNYKKPFGVCFTKEYKPGWNNKIFVKVDLMPYQIHITNIRLRHLQDISDEDCLKEGIRRWENEKEYVSDETIRKSVDELKKHGYIAYAIPGCWIAYPSAKEAYAALIDKISGEGTWEKNPWVFVYDFELVK